MKNHINVKKRGSFILIISLLGITNFFFACTKELNFNTPKSVLDELSKQDRQGKAGVFPVNLDEYNIIGSKTATKSSSSAFLPLNIDSLLILEQSETISFGPHIQYTQIPLKKRAQYSSASVISNLDDLKNTNRVSAYQSYFIIYENTKLNLNLEYIVTLLPSVTTFSNTMPPCTYLQKPNFSGVIMYSDKNGEFLKLYHYLNGRIVQGELIKPSDIQASDTINYIVEYTTTSVSTKSEEECSCNDCMVCKIHKLNEITIVAYRINKDDDQSKSYIEHVCHNINTSPNTGGAGMPGIKPGGEKPGGEPMIPTTGDPLEQPDPLYFWVMAYTSNPAYGTTTGSGKYANESTATIEATPNPGCKFVQWNGHFSGNHSGYSFLVTANITTTAVFVLVTPCIDINLFKANPVGFMELQPANGWNIPGATYGYTRSSGKQFHSGVDLKGEVGTPIFSMFTGTIDKCITEQPNRIGDKYPTDYKGEKNAAGNRVDVISSVNGKPITLKYWHLQAGTPVAINPRTGAPFKQDDTIYQGEIIGYIGVTGNAKEAFPHLHLTIMENGKTVNPANYLNATIGTTSTTVNTPCK